MKVFVLPCGRREKGEVGSEGAVLAIPHHSRSQPPLSRGAQMSLRVPFAPQLHPLVLLAGRGTRAGRLFLGMTILLSSSSSLCLREDQQLIGEVIF